MQTLYFNSSEYTKEVEIYVLLPHTLCFKLQYMRIMYSLSRESI